MKNAYYSSNINRSRKVTTKLYVLILAHSPYDETIHLSYKIIVEL